MRFWVAAFCLLVSPPAFAQGTDSRAVRAIVADIYKGYTKPDGASTPPRTTARFAAVQKECADLGAALDQVEGPDSAYGTCANDYDLFCQCQDPEGIEFARMKVSVRFPASDRAEAVLRWSRKPGLKLSFVRQQGAWLLDDAWEYMQLESGAEPSYRKQLVSEIADLRTRLKMPPWQEPAL